MTRKNSTRKCVDLNTTDVEWFEQTYPEGSFSWILSMLLSEFRTAATQDPKDYAKVGAEALQKMIHESMSEVTGD